ncbi:methyltransferase [Pyxidicoccus fallax]|uniref:Methyltransferase n=1 Tax=Pyxidicoccus fallax TaxID=394095 RepID=A0A848LIH4_9BACT|nr:methyltransferase [Pyxidicoccus fallax]NMO17522.1 methyltransferase [Pyxidicoccus fallax]NPC81539.1 methyltransferase [Pyxidicoccus fallax]
MATSFWVPLAIHTAAKWRVADVLEDGSKTVAELARATDTQEDPLRRVLRALASLGIFAETEDGRFAHTPMSRTLRSDAPGSLRDFMMMIGADWYWRAWGQLPHSIKTTQPGFDQVFGEPVFEYLSKHAEAATVFNRAMTGFSAMSGAEVAPERYDFSQVKTVVDVAGGHGSFLARVLKTHPHLRGGLFDQPAVVAEAQAMLAESGVADRCTLLGGDFFESVPESYDVYMMKMIIHDWKDAQALRILQNCRKAMLRDAKLLLVEQLMPERAVPGPHHFIDLAMLSMLGSKVRTVTEFRALLAQAGFELTRTIDLVHGFAILESKPS